MVFLVIMVVALFAIVALAVDLAVLFLSSRQAQRAVDAASLAAVTLFKDQSPTASLQAWQISKKASLGGFSVNPIHGLNTEASHSLYNNQGTMSSGQLFSYQSGDGTGNGNQSTYYVYDLPGYKGITGTSGNLTITMLRGIICYQPSGASFVRRWYSLEQPDGVARYCHVNSVRHYLTIKNVATFFGSLVGTSLIPKFKASATSYLLPPNSCGVPLCSDLGVVGGADSFGNNYFEPSIVCS